MPVRAVRLANSLTLGVSMPPISFSQSTDGGSSNDVPSVYELAARILGSQEAAKTWLSSSQLRLDGKRPIDLLATESGRELVKALLLRMK